MPPESAPPDPDRDDALPAFAIPWMHAVHRARAAMLCGCNRRTVRVGETYVTIGAYGRVNCWGCLVFYGWATLADVPPDIRPEIVAAQDRQTGYSTKRRKERKEGRRGIGSGQ